MKKYLEQIIGTIQESVFLVMSAMLYHIVIIEYIREGKYLFLGSDYWFIIEIMMFPLVNIVLKKYKRLIGNICGVLVYFIILIPLAMLLGGA